MPEPALTERSITAHHEAGHAVVACALGVPFWVVAIVVNAHQGINGGLYPKGFEAEHAASDADAGGRSARNVRGSLRGGSESYLCAGGGRHPHGGSRMIDVVPPMI